LPTLGFVQVRRKEEIARKQREAEEAARLEAERIAQEQEDRRLAAIKRQERLAKYACQHSASMHANLNNDDAGKKKSGV
jgi:uncharacterized protein YkwD